MSFEGKGRSSSGGYDTGGLAGNHSVAGKRTLTEALPPIDRSAANQDSPTSAAPQLLQSAEQSSGSGLPAPIQGKLEQSLGADLSGVRVHTGGESAAASSAIHANAYTVGQDIHFGAGQFDAGGASGQRLIAHEVAHTVQQRGAGTVRQAQLEVSAPGDAHEVEADTFANSFMSGGATPVTPVAAGSVSRMKIDRDPLPGAAPAAATPAPAAGPAGATPAPATWRVPASVVPALYPGSATLATKDQVALFLRVARSNVQGLVTRFGLVDRSHVDSMTGSIDNQIAQYTGNDPLTARDTGDMNMFVTLLHGAYQQQMNAIASDISARMQTLHDQAVEPPELEGIEEELAEEMHNKFKEGNEEAISHLSETLHEINHYREVTELFLPWITGTISLLGGEHTAEKMEQFEHGAKRFGQGLAILRGIVDAGRMVNRALSHGSASGMDASLNQFSNAINAIDIGMTFAAGVPVLGQLWTFYYRPLTMACINGIRKIAHATDHEARQLTLLEWMQTPRPAGATPVIPRDYMSFFEGGQPVLNVMYPLLNGGDASMNPTAEQFFLSRRDLFNAGGSGQLAAQSNWHVLSPSTWGASDSAPNIMGFLENNKARVWAMLYGSLPHDLR